MVSGRGSGGVALTINDGKGNANVTFNHQNGVPEQNGNAARIEVNTDSTTGANMNFELKSGVTSGTSVELTTTLNLTENDITFKSNVVWHAGNDGSGSGLDADTVDGLQASQFLRSDATDSFTDAQKKKEALKELSSREDNVEIQVATLPEPVQMTG